MTEKDTDWDKVYRPSEQIVTRKIADETILVPISGDLANMQQIFTVNEVGASIWTLLDGKKSLNEIKQALLHEFEIKEQQLAADILDFIKQLQQAKLVLEN